jgi:hypothetical protein
MTGAVRAGRRSGARASTSGPWCGRLSCVERRADEDLTTVREVHRARICDLRLRFGPEAVRNEIMQFQTQGMPRKLIQTPELIVILYEASMGIRQVFMDGRPLPEDDSQPWWYGYSVGRWEDDTLVVETSGLRDDGWLDVFGTPLTDAARLTERFRRVSYGRMEIDITVDDPKAYSSPWTVRVNQRLLPAEELIEFVCLENQRFTAR